MDLRRSFGNLIDVRNFFFAVVLAKRCDGTVILYHVFEEGEKKKINFGFQLTHSRLPGLCGSNDHKSAIIWCSRMQEKRKITISLQRQF